MSKRVLIVLANQFRDEELFVPLCKLEAAGYSADLAGLAIGTYFGMLGESIEVNLLIDQVEVQNYDLLMIPGGEGTLLLRDSLPVLELVRSFEHAGKLVAAICWAPTILAKAGVLRGKKAVSCHIEDHAEERCEMSQEVMAKYGARQADKHVIKDGRLITADGPRYASEFADLILKSL